MLCPRNASADDSKRMSSLLQNSVSSLENITNITVKNNSPLFLLLLHLNTHHNLKDWNVPLEYVLLCLN